MIFIDAISRSVYLSWVMVELRERRLQYIWIDKNEANQGAHGCIVEDWCSTPTPVLIVDLHERIDRYQDGFAVRIDDVFFRGDKERAILDILKVQNDIKPILEYWQPTTDMERLEKAVASNLMDDTPRMVLADEVEALYTPELANLIRGPQGRFIVLAWTSAKCKPSLVSWVVAFTQWQEMWKQLVLPKPEIVEEMAKEFRNVGISAQSFVTLMTKGLLDAQRTVRKALVNPPVPVPTEGDPQAPTLPGGESPR